MLRNGLSFIISSVEYALFDYDDCRFLSFVSYLVFSVFTMCSPHKEAGLP